MKTAFKIFTAVIGLLVIARAALVGIDFLYKKYGHHYIDAAE